jgi:hypothetical protein
MCYRHLGFTIDRLTVTTSVTCASWESDSPSRLARFSSELDLMPIRHDNLPDFGRIRTEPLRWSWPSYSALQMRPSAAPSQDT